jgi:hypothetical protein
MGAEQLSEEEEGIAEEGSRIGVEDRRETTWEMARTGGQETPEREGLG